MPRGVVRLSLGEHSVLSERRSLQQEENLEMGLSACCFRTKQRITVGGHEETEDQ